MYGKLSWLPILYVCQNYYYWFRPSFSAREFLDPEYNERTTAAETAAPHGHAAAWDCRWG